MLRSLVSIDDLTLDEIDRILALAGEFAKQLGGGTGGRLQGRLDLANGWILATLFHEPSTRTRLSFESAMIRLGGAVISAADPASSSAAKGESVADAVRVVHHYADAIILRHPLEGSARLAARHARVPVINGGDGGHQHPSQTLGDLYTLQRRLGPLDKITVQVRGDLRHGRTVHSLAVALARFGATVVTAPAPGLDLPGHVIRQIEPGRVVADDEHTAKIDAIYVTRLQKERFGAGGLPTTYARVDAAVRKDPRLAESLILHPLPRVDELDPSLDNDPRATWFEQAAAGVPVRMALLAAMLGLREGVLSDRATQQPVVTDRATCSNPACITQDPTERAFALPEFTPIDKSDSLLRCEWCGTEVSI